MKKIETFCPVRDIMSRFGDKWSILVLLSLDEREVMRFSELAREIPDVSQKMLTVTLRTLEADRLISREVYPEIPPRVEYRLTELGLTLIPHVRALVDWALEHQDECLKKRDGGCCMSTVN